MDELTSTIDLLPKRSLARSQGPLYRQLADILREPIRSGAFRVGAELPKEAVIADHFGVSLITVRQALRDLEADGLIKKRSAKPAIITSSQPPVTLSWTFKNFADMAAFTKDAELKVKSYRKESSPVLQRHFGLAKDEAGYCLRSMLVVGKQRKAQITTYFPPTLGAKLTKADFNDVLIFRAVQRRLNIRMAVAHCTVRAEIADESVAADLGVTVGSAILAVEMLYQAADQSNVEFTIARHPADMFSITYDAPNDLA
ncbi:GntR family transcriptional regulator [Devosia sp.]|jgi:GntR family transcriptional regulator|uniref:GntR family transcriptional regulator n=1 Tax=Devosia sp. TaxID=1871048 RepID=UPI0037BE5E34